MEQVYQVAYEGMGRAQCLLSFGDLAQEDGGYGSELAAELVVPGWVCGCGGGGLAVYKMRIDTRHMGFNVVIQNRF